MKLAINTLQPARGAKRAKKRVGRGNASGHGTYSTRGMKGQRARSGGKAGLRARAIKDLVQSTPKSRGFKSFKVKPVTVTLSTLNKYFNDGDTVDMSGLREKKIVGKNVKVAKVVATGELKKKLIVNLPMSKRASGLVGPTGDTKPSNVVEKKDATPVNKTTTE